MTVNDPYEIARRGAFTISTDPARLDVALIHSFLAERSYWARGIPLDVLRRAIAGSLCFGIYEGNQQVGFARAITDRATFAYLGDVFVLETHRGQGLSKWLLECILAHPDLQGLRRFNLVTADAHGLYQAFGFGPLAHPERHLEIVRPDVYQKEG
jgi:GNAT superfamily N-acetyltransferase